MGSALPFEFTKPRHQVKIKNLRHIIFILIFPLVLFYYELIFKLVTGTALTATGVLLALMSSTFFGIAVYLLSSLPINKIACRIIACVLLFLPSLLFLTQYFVFKQFNIFYDITTMTSGAKDALTFYNKEAIALIASPDGVLLLLAYFLPTVLLASFSHRLFPEPRSTAPARLFSSSAALIALDAAIIITVSNPFLLSKATEEYSYQSAAEDFGLLPGMVLDLKNIIFPEESEFVPIVDELIPPPEIKTEEAESCPAETGESDTSEGETDAPVIDEPIVYGKNELEIDFDALNSTANAKQAALNNYVASLTASDKNKYTGLFEGKNLIFITAEAFSSAVIDEELTPTLYRLATRGINFTDYYQQAGAGTTGGEYQNIFGMLPMQSGGSFKQTQYTYNYLTIASQLDRLGYYGKAYHNNTYTYYDRHLTHVNLGYSDGYMGMGNGMEEYVSSNWPQSDYEMISGTLPTYIDKDKFNIYYMSVSGHGTYSQSSNSMSRKHYDRVAHLPYSEEVKCYLAANLDLEDALAYLVAELEAHGIADDTVIVVAADHFPYGLPSDALTGKDCLSELYGYTVGNVFDRDSSTLIIWSGCLEDDEPIVVDTPTSSLDILPTLSNLFGCEFDSRFMVGRDVFSNASALVFYSNYSFKTEYGTYLSTTGEFILASENIVIPDGYVDRVKAIIRNKIKYCTDVPTTDYFRHVFGGDAPAGSIG